MSYEIEGKLVEKFDTVVVSDRFKKREFVLEKEENAGGSIYTESIKFQLTQNRVELVEPYAVGDAIKVSFNIKGNKWEKDGRVNYFTNLDAWRVEKASATAGSQDGVDAPWPDEPPADQSFEDDDLPF